MSHDVRPGIARRHDLDALRAFAMLLGIALHAALSYTGFPWAVQDTRTHEGFVWLFAAIHGFRMPLFILVSGYFTMMLWRRRGLTALVKQRTLRVLVPCLLGLVTVVPALEWAGKWAFETGSRQESDRRSQITDRSAVVESIRTRDPAELKRILSAGADPNEVDPEFKIPPLNWAAMFGDIAAAEALIDAGANVEAPDQGGYRPVHGAAFMGHPAVIRLLVRRGADPAARAFRGDNARDSSRADKETTAAITAALGLPSRDPEELESGRAACRAALEKLAGNDSRLSSESSGRGIAGWREQYREFLTSESFLIESDWFESPFHLILTPVFHHLWFLWFLCWLVALFAGAVGLAQVLRLPAVPKGIVTSPLCWMWLAPLTMVPQLLMGVFAPGFGPDTSVGLLPQPHLLLYYGLFFAFGALYYDSDDGGGRLGRWWWISLPLAAAALVYEMATEGQTMISGAVQVVYAWAMTAGLIGLFRKYLGGENRTVRYLSDSAYWLYLAHLPLVILMQAWIRTWEVPAAAKFSLICVAVTGLLLITYQIAVRPTWIGWLLNGPTGRRPVTALAHSEVAASHQAP